LKLNTNATSKYDTQSVQLAVIIIIIIVVNVRIYYNSGQLINNGNQQFS